MPWTIDLKHSHVGFSVKHLMISLVRGAFHTYTATIDIPPNDLTHSSFKGEIDAASIDTHVPERDVHLRSADFLDVAHYPKITFESTSVEALGSNHFRVEGNLTIRGVTRPVVIEGEYAGEPVVDPWGGKRTGISGTTTLLRSEYGLVWNQLLEGGGVVASDTVRVDIDLELVWQEPSAPAQTEAAAQTAAARPADPAT